jgi:hypothetical protein
MISAHISARDAKNRGEKSFEKNELSCLGEETLFLKSALAINFNLQSSPRLEITKKVGEYFFTLIF